MIGRRGSAHLLIVSIVVRLMEEIEEKYKLSTLSDVKIYFK